MPLDATSPAPRRPLLIVPGLRDSGPGHWQTRWQEALPDARRVVQADWEAPALDAWSATVARALDAFATPPIIVAHSFGCLATVHAAAFWRRPIAGALLVAPTDPDRFGFGRRLGIAPLPFPTTLVASTNDPWLKVTKAGALATRWGARLVVLENAGHINAEAGFGEWPQGLELLAGLDAGPVDAPRLRVAV